MIDLTPLEVRQKKGDFRRTMRGYDADLVDDFLDLVADRMEELVKERMRLADTVEELKEELASFQKKERELSEALVAAQKMREDTHSQARKESELLIREARLEAESARHQASRALAREEELLRQVRSRRGQLVESFRRMLERELAELAVIEETLELEAARIDAEAPLRTAAERLKGDVEEVGDWDEIELSDLEASEAGSEDAPEPGADHEHRPDEEPGDDESSEEWLKSLVEE